MRSEQERDQETEGDRECFSSEHNVVIYPVAAKQITRLPVLWLSQWGAVRFRCASPFSMQQTQRSSCALSAFATCSPNILQRFLFWFMCFSIPQRPSRCSSRIALTYFLCSLGKWHNRCSQMTKLPHFLNTLHRVYPCNLYIIENLLWLVKWDFWNCAHHNVNAIILQWAEGKCRILGDFGHI